MRASYSDFHVVEKIEYSFECFPLCYTKLSERKLLLGVRVITLRALSKVYTWVIILFFRKLSSNSAPEKSNIVFFIPIIWPFFRWRHTKKEKWKMRRKPPQRKSECLQQHDAREKKCSPKKIKEFYLPVIQSNKRVNFISSYRWSPIWANGPIQARK